MIRPATEKKTKQQIEATLQHRKQVHNPCLDTQPARSQGQGGTPLKNFLQTMLNKTPSHNAADTHTQEEPKEGNGGWSASGKGASPLPSLLAA